MSDTGLAALCPPASLARAVSMSLRMEHVEMDSNSDSMDSFLPKVETTENERECYRMARLNWNSDNTMKLIETLERDCHELWNVKHPGYKNKSLKQLKYELLADMFSTTVEEITRKIHNLRSQFNNELRKIRKKQDTAGEESGGGSGWEYFDALTFLKTVNLNEVMPDPLELEAVNLELAEFQAEEQEEFRNVAARALKEASHTRYSPVRRKPVLRVAASAPPPLPPSAHPMMWPEQPIPRISTATNADESQIFGDFVASELRVLRSIESRKKLKRIIQKAILEIGEEEDVIIRSIPSSISPDN